MQTSRISTWVALIASILLGACTTAPARKAASAEQAPVMLSMPEHAIDALPLEYLLAAEFALREERLGEAARIYLDAALASQDVGIARRATRINLAAQRWQDAGRALQHWRSLDGGEGSEIVQAESVLALGQGDADRAGSHLLALLKQATVESIRLAASALEAAPDRGLAIQVLEQLARSPDLPDDAAVLIGLSQLSVQMERADTARTLAERATERLPELPDVWFWHARLLHLEGDDERARQVLERAVAVNPESPDIRRTYAVLLKNELGDARGAARALAGLPPDEETLALRAAYAMDAQDAEQVADVQAELASLPTPHPAGRLLLIGGLAETRAEWIAAQNGAEDAQARGLREQAVHWYGQVGEDDSVQYVRALQRLAVLDQQSGRIDSALQRIAAIREHPDGNDAIVIESFLLEAELLEREQRLDEALAALDLGVRTMPEDERLRYSRGLLNERLDHVEAALADFRALVEAHPENPVFLNAYGYTLTDRTNQHQQALVMIERALAMQPDDIATLDSMGWVLYRLERHGEAIWYLRRAYEAQPDPEIAAHLGEVLWVVGQRDEARAIWEAAAQEDPEHRVLKTTIERFRP